MLYALCTFFYSFLRFLYISRDPLYMLATHSKLKTAIILKTILSTEIILLISFCKIHLAVL